MSYTRTVVVTGGTANLGYYAALDIARQHPEYRIIISSRSDPNAAADTINKTLAQKNVSFLPLDLSSLSNVRAFANDFKKKDYPPIIYLLLNAGLQFPNELQLTGDGFESTFAINHLGHALLFHLLTPHLAPNARIVVTSSGTHDPAQNSGLPDANYTTAEELAHPSEQSAQTNTGRQRYATSKLVNVLWTYATARHLSGTNITINAFDPGLMPGTGLAREYTPFLRFIWNHVMTRVIPLMRLVMFKNIHTPAESGASLAWVAMSDELQGKTGLYYEGRKAIKSSADSYVVEKQDELWDWTVRHTVEDGGKYLDLKV